jgi:protein dithiol oxidoreductase (disulfide-forming)
MKSLAQLATLLVAWAVFAVPGSAETYVEGTHYTRLADPVPVRQSSKIEVAEIFSYSCGHCYTFENLIGPWKQAQPDDVYFVRLHVMWDRTTENLARALYTAQALGVVDKVHPALFRAIHVERKPLQTREEIANIFSQQGVDKALFNKTFNAFGIVSQVKQGASKIAGARISSTPSLLVDGRYVINASEKVNHQTMLDIADYLVKRTRQER